MQNDVGSVNTELFNPLVYQSTCSYTVFICALIITIILRREGNCCTLDFSVPTDWKFFTSSQKDEAGWFSWKWATGQTVVIKYVISLQIPGQIQKDWESLSVHLQYPYTDFINATAFPYRGLHTENTSLNSIKILKLVKNLYDLSVTLKEIKTTL